MSESKHTPTPWTMDEVRTQVGRAFRIGSGEMLRAGKGCCIIYDDFRTPGQDSERQANAAFIVEACNSHEASKAIIAELVKALEPFAEAMDAFGEANLDDEASLFRAIHAGSITITGISIGDLRRAKAILSKASASNTGGGNG